MRGFVAFIALALTLTGCTGGVVGAGDPTAIAPSPTSTEPSAVAEIDALFDVGGHQLHLHCQGSGSPTVIYLHGMSHTGDSGEANAESAAGLPGLLSAKRRYCGYDRANVGTSDDVPGPLTGASSARDLEKLLQAGQIEPPYVLLGASFGGLIAHIYAAEHPEQVTGLLLLDAGFPDELDLEKHFPPTNG